MIENESKILSWTQSVCPVCLARLPATRVAYDDAVYLEKTCPEHGSFKTVIWRGQPSFDSWVRPKNPSHPRNPFTSVKRGCPFDCGLCPDHRQESCNVLLEVTQRCDLRCPICFADAGGDPAPDPDLSVVESWYRRLLEAGGPYNIQLSGGEPSLRDDLPQIITLGRSMGFSFFQLNTNGLRLARDPEYLHALVEAGLSTVFLQFDGTHDPIYRKLRGRPLLERKLAAIEQCASQQVGVVLVPTIVPGVNSDNIGGILEFALRFTPSVRGVHFQPVSYFGRYPLAPQDADRFTIPEVMRAVEAQTQGKISITSFCPPGCENALCSFHGNYVVMPDGSLAPLTYHADALGSCCGPAANRQPEDAAIGAARARKFVARNWSAPPEKIILASGLPILDSTSLGEWDVFLQRARTHTFCISGMAFQDAWNLDLERLKDCCIHNMHPDGRLIPFCAYNLTDQSGRSLFRPAG
jgi:tetraether lipid synthase